MGKESMIRRLEQTLKPNRFIHSLGVRDTAVHLAKLYGANEKKAEIAGLLHDNAKNMDNIYERCRDLEVELDDPRELYTLFPEMKEYEKDCRFAGCSHIKEKECAVWSKNRAMTRFASLSHRRSKV